MQLLIVDDSKIERMILKEMLESEGYAVQEAENGKQALEMSLLSCPDMIISDILMPVMDGFKLCREIRADKRTCEIPFVVYTGTYTKSEDEDFAYKMGADRFLVKKMEWSDFFRELQNVIREKAMGSSVLSEAPCQDEKEIYKLYNQRLIKKLEDKVTALEKEIDWRKKLEKQLYESQESLQLALEGAHLGMWDWNIQTGKIRFNQQWLEKFGYDLDDVPPDISFWGKLIHPDDRQSSRDLLDANLKGDTEIYENEYRVKTRSGEWQWVFARGKVASRDESGNPLRHVGTLIEVSDRKNALIALEKSEEKYRTILESMEDGYFEVDLSGNLTFFNNALSDLLGYPASELMGKNYRAFMDEEYAQKTYQRFRQIFETGKSAKEFDWKIVQKDGVDRYLDALVSPIMDSMKQISGFRGVVRDVSERRLMQRFLAESEERYRLVFESAPVGIFHYDTKGIILACNQAFVDLNGSSFEKLIGFNLLKSLTNTSVLKAVQKSLAGSRGHYEGEYTSVTGGRKSYLKGDLVPVFSENKSLSGGMCVVDDITERKRAKEALKQSEEKFKRIAENSPGIIMLSDQDGVCRFVSPSIERILGYRQEEVIGTVPTDFYAPEQADRIMNAISMAMQGKAENRFEVEVQRKDGSFAFLELECIAVQEEGRIVGVQYLGKDITEQKKAEKALKDSRQQLRELSKHLQSSREQERAGIAREIHDDLGQSLTAIKMDAAWLKSKLPENLTALHKKAEDTIILVDSAIQTVKRISSELRPGLLDDLGLSAAIEWQAKEYQKRSGINISVTMEPEEIVLEADLSIAIFRVCQETLTNVVRHAGAADAWVYLSKNSQQMVFEVADNGCGISEQAMTKKNSFGLIGMRERVHAIGGTISISRIPEGGTKVAVKVPLGAET